MEKDQLIPAFGRQEGFYPKYNHFKKLLDCAEKDSKLFSSDSASITLGIGKSHVKALKFWGLAFKIIREDNKGVFIDDLGRDILNDDPYLEKLETIMLLQDTALALPCRIPSWYFLFKEFKQTEFTKQDLIEAIQKWQKELFPDVQVAGNAIEKDVNCILGMYMDTESPFSELNLIQNNGEYYRLRSEI